MLETSLNSIQKKVTMHNSLIRASHGLSLSEKRIVAMAITQLTPSRKTVLEKPVRIRAVDFAEQFGIDQSESYKQLRDAQERLWQRYVRHIEYYGANGQKVEVIRTRWISSVHYKDKEGEIAVNFTPEIMPLLVALQKHFTTYHLSQAAALRSTYSWRLFENIKSHQSLNEWRVDLERFHKVMETTASHRANFAQLRKWVLIPACREIAEKCGVVIKWQPEKRGRKVVGLYFTFDFEGEVQLGFQLKNPNTKSSSNELPGLFAFPDRGGISYEKTWAKIARDNLPTPTPDLTMVATAFREWCRYKSIALNAKGMDKTFTTFCQKYTPFRR